MAALKERPEDGKASGERIAKVIARSGLCSRRDAEALIGEKRVSVNGSVIDSAALDVSPADTVLVDGMPLSTREPPRLWRYYKPKGRVTTHKDPEGRPTVFEALPEELPRLISVGRLDFNTEGLLLLTNDGDLARHLELPSTGWTRRYRVRAYGQIEQSKLDEIKAGLRTGGVNYGPIEATLEREQGDNVWITLSIREGKNREVRRIMEHLGLTVNRLIRVSFGPFILGDLETGQIEEVKTSVLKDQLGPRLSRQLGVKREPMREERPLAPGRAKPTYLRRKPSAPPRPSRPEDEPGPLKRRRILQIDGSEAPKVEFVREKKPRPDRFGPRQGDGEKPERRSRAARPEREDRRERPSRPDGERPWSKAPDRDRAPGDRAPRPGRDRDAGERPAFRSRKSGEDERERPAWRPRTQEGGEREQRERPSSRDGERRWSKAPDREGRAPGDRAPRPGRDRDAGERPAFRSRNSGEGERERRAWRPRIQEGGEREERKQPPSRDGERRYGKSPDRKARASTHPASRPARDSSERPAYPPRKRAEGERQRPAWRDRSGEGAAPWKARSEQGAERPRAQFRRREDDQGKARPPRRDRETGEKRAFEGDGGRPQEPRPERRPSKPYRKDEARGDTGKPRTFEKRSFKGPKRASSGAGKGGKPFKRREGGPADRPRPTGPRKPRPATDKETT